MSVADAETLEALPSCPTEGNCVSSSSFKLVRECHSEILRRAARVFSADLQTAVAVDAHGMQIPWHPRSGVPRAPMFCAAGGNMRPFVFWLREALKAVWPLAAHLAARGSEVLAENCDCRVCTAVLVLHLELARFHC